MTIKKFELDKGVYVFEESNLTAQFHAHPILELVIARQGSFSVSTKEKSLEDIQCCLIMPHEIHAFEGKNCNAAFIFIEGSSTNFKEIIWALGVSNAKDGIIEIKEKFKQQIEEVVFETLEYPKRYAHDERIVACKRLINQKIHQPKIKLADLAQEVCLSPSRLSHLFREQMGMPIRSFIIWERMKIAIHDLLQNDLNLTEAAYSAGFYDVAHFTKNFKELFGVTPSVVYNNSRIVQA